MTGLLKSWHQLATISAVVLIAACATYGEQPPQAAAPAKPAAGGVMTNAKGMTLYTYDKDTAGQSNCYSICAEYWPPLLADATSTPSGDLTLITRSDGKKQWAENGKPLYTFAEDEKAGDVNGDNYDGIWHVVK